MLIAQIMAAPTPKFAVSYDPESKCLLYENAEVIGLVQLENPDEPNEIQQLPCYLVANKYGFFWVPELEYNFLIYVDKGQNLSMDSNWIKARIAEIEADYVSIGNEAQKTETIEVETKGKVTHIRRKIKHVKNEEEE